MTAAEIFIRKELLDEMRRQHEAQLNALSSARRMVRSVMGPSSLLISIVAAFIASNPGTCDAVCVGNMKLAAILFVFQLLLFMWVTATVELYFPVQPSKEKIKVAFSLKSEKVYLERVIAAYLGVIEKNRPIVMKRTGAAAGATVAFSMMLVILILPLFSLM